MKMTKKNIVAQIASGTTTLAALAKAFDLKPSATSSAAMEKLVPDLRDRLKNAKGVKKPVIKVEKAHPASVSTTVPTAEPEQITPPTETKTETETIKVKEVIVHYPNPFNRCNKPAGTIQAALYDMGAEKEMPIDELVANAIKTLNRPEHTIRAFVGVLCDPNDVHNSRTSRNVSSRTGLVHLARVEG